MGTGGGGLVGYGPLARARCELINRRANRGSSAGALVPWAAICAACGGWNAWALAMAGIGIVSGAGIGIVSGGSTAGAVEPV